MRINSTNQISFKGYDASPIKNIYMLTFADKCQNHVRSELNSIAKEEGFDLFVEDAGKLYKDEEMPKKPKYNIYKWSQDNKIFINGKNGDYLLTPSSNWLHKHKGELHNLLGIEQKDSKVLFAGGNVFLGKKPDGEKYILVGDDVILDTSIREYLKDIDCWYGNDRDIYNFEKSDDKKEEKLDFYSKSEQPRPRKKEFAKKKGMYADRVKDFISEDFDVKKENIFVVPQQVFHIDMFLRPIGYPYILVNSEEEAKKLIKNNLGKTPEEYGVKRFTDEYYSFLNKDNGNIKTKDVVTSLRNQGFIPIEVGGIFGMHGMANFMNAIVNKHKDGTITYITNSSACDDKAYTKLQTLFDKQLREKLPNLKDVHYIYGGRVKDINAMMDNLMDSSGGLHCMVCEEPDFEAWA